MERSEIVLERIKETWPSDFSSAAGVLPPTGWVFISDCLVPYVAPHPRRFSGPRQAITFVQNRKPALRDDRLHETGATEVASLLPGSKFPGSQSLVLYQ
jgi:hypothetical protein